MTFLKLLRMEKASEILQEPDGFLQIKEIAYRVGYRDVSRFVRDFRNFSGYAPTAFRDNCSNKHQSNSEIDNK